MRLGDLTCDSLGRHGGLRQQGCRAFYLLLQRTCRRWRQRCGWPAGCDRQPPSLPPLPAKLWRATTAWPPLLGATAGAGAGAAVGMAAGREQQEQRQRAAVTGMSGSHRPMPLDVRRRAQHNAMLEPHRGTVSETRLTGKRIVTEREDYRIFDLRQGIPTKTGNSARRKRRPSHPPDPGQSIFI